MKPLAFRVRPTRLEDIIGQNHILGKDKILFKLIKSGNLESMIFFGPPGTGKTTTAIAIAKELNKPYRLFNAVSDNKKRLDQLFLEAEMSNGLIVIIDEVHRLNKDKQDILLPHIESGLITIIGATTANPYFSINPAIRSRVHLFEFKPLSNHEIQEILVNAIPNDYTVDEEIIEYIANTANGDARFSLNILDLLIKAYSKDKIIDPSSIESLSLGYNISMDKDSDNYYDTLSAFQKSIRGSDVHASLYYLAKLIHVGDLDSIERRLLTTVYEDIGLANPALCARVHAAVETAKKIGFPEAKHPLSVAVIEAALSPKSKSAQYAIERAMNSVKNIPLQVPSYLHFTPVNLKPEDTYAYDRPDLWYKIQYLPNEIKDEKFYQPINLQSAEKILAKNLQELDKVDRTSNLRKLYNENKNQ